MSPRTTDLPGDAGAARAAGGGAAPPDASPSRPRLWPHLRAAFIGFHVLAVLVAATPSTASALHRSAWDDPTVQAEFAAWAPRLGVDVPTLTDRLWVVANGWNTLRHEALVPFAPYIDAVGAVQSWQMFVAPHTFPTRLQLDEQRTGAPTDEAGGWIPLFEERSPTLRWMAPVMGVERLRASIFRWGWESYAGAYHQACRALAARRFAEDPAVTAFRCRFHKVRTPSAAEQAAADAGISPLDPGRTVFPYVVRRPAPPAGGP